ncbi:winged helix-turn-helix transcriptional regulator [Streptomyces acidiscabies]|uniref:winged helix-turn-helix transcriptional regulator n=1 Tax=Streptomyces acidiscabies TaxID=42234 RepID=UPI000D19BC5E
MPSPGEERFLRGLHDVRHVMNGEWTWDILVTLCAKPLQYTRLLDTIRAQNNETRWPGRKHLHLQDSQLNRTLRRLEQAELVRRTRESVFPYRTTYELSIAARELLGASASLVLWTEVHSDLLERTRQRRKEEGPR